MAPAQKGVDASTEELLVSELASLQEELYAAEKAAENAAAFEVQHTYVVVKGMIVDASNVFAESMDVDDAKAWCNSNDECLGFTFAGPTERPDDEVAVTFKAGSKIAYDSSWVSYVKSTPSVFGSLHAGLMLHQSGKGGGLAELALTYSTISAVVALVFVAALLCSRLHTKRPGGAWRPP